MWLNIFLISMSAFNIGSRFERICNSLMNNEKPQGFDLFFFFFGIFGVIWGAAMLIINK